MDEMEPGKEGNEVIRSKVKVFCPFCEYEHELDYIEKMDTIEIKGDVVEYESHYYYCPKHPEEQDGFVNGKMMDENLDRARNAYSRINDEKE